MLQSHGGPDLVLRKGGAAPPGTRRKTMALCRGRGGGILWIRTYKIWIMRTSGFVPQVGWGMPLPSCDTKPRFCVASRALDQKVGFRHLRHARSSRLVKSASFDETKRLGGVWTQNGGLGNQIKKSKKVWSNNS